MENIFYNKIERIERILLRYLIEYNIETIVKRY